MFRKRAKKNPSTLIKVALGTNLLVICFLLLAYLAPSIDPMHFWPIAFFGLSYILLLFTNVIFIILWLVFGKVKYVIPSALAILVGWKFLVANIGFHKPTPDEGQKVLPNHIRLMTYNVHSFKEFGFKTPISTRARILKIIAEEQPDILCMQEYVRHESKKHDISRSLQEILGTPYVYAPKNAWDTRKTSELIIISKYPIVHEGRIFFPNNSGSEAIYIDIKYHKQILRVYNLHLQSIGFNLEDYQYLRKVQAANANMQSSRRIGSRLKQAFLKRSEQVKIIKAHTQKCHKPYIILGDFNDTPTSYALQCLSKGLKNAFAERGTGIGITYNGDFPNFQIDYILTTQEFEVKNYYIVPKKLSDHYAVRSDVEIRS